MNPYSAYTRRLRVSALAAVANPSYTRIDTWNLLDDACRHLAEVDLAGLDKSHEVAKVRRLMDRLGAYERYWLYPGAENLATFRAHLERLSTVRLADEVSLAVRLLSEYGDRTALFDTFCPVGRPGVGGPSQTAAVLHGAARRRLAHGTRLPGRKPAGVAQLI